MNQKIKANQGSVALWALIAMIVVISGISYGVYYFSSRQKMVPLEGTKSERTIAQPPPFDSSAKLLEEEPTSQVENGEPTKKPEESLENGWLIYRNQEFGFELQHPKDWRNEEYGPFNGGMLKLHQTLLTELKDPNVYPNRKVFWQINIWQLAADRTQIVNDVFAGLIFKKENRITIGGRPAIELVYFGPSQILGGMHIYRLYIVHNENFAYSMTSDLCMDDKKPECDKIISSFKLLP